MILVVISSHESGMGAYVVVTRNKKPVAQRTGLRASTRVATLCASEDYTLNPKLP